MDSRDADAVIRRMAARQHGVVSREQLERAGVEVHRIEYRVKTGRLQPLYRGVYCASPILGPRANEMAAVLACNATALVSHRSAGAVWTLIPAAPPEVRVDVGIQRGWNRPGPGVRVHRLGPLPADEVARLDGVPITTPARTLLDLAGCLGIRELERALARADRQGMAKREDIELIMARHPGRRGTRALRTLLGDGGPALTRSEAEAGFLALIRRAGLREPLANVLVQGYEVDFLWREERLIVEVDGFAFHSSRSAFEADRHRDAALVATGFRTMRVTWRQLNREPHALIAAVAQALAQQRGGSPVGR